MFSDLELARRLERTEAHAGAKFVEARAKAFPQSRSQWIEVAGTYAMYDGVDSPTTQCFGLGLFQPVAGADLGAIEEFFRERGASVNHEVSPLAGLSVLTLLLDRGYRPVELTSVMYLTISATMEFTPPRNEGIRARLIGSDEFPLWVDTCAKGWSEYPGADRLFADLGKIRARTDDSVSFLAELDGKPIAAGGLSLNAGVALLAGACTVPEFRNQGAQLALLECRLRYAAAHGCNLAMMCAEPGGGSQRNAERNGFRIAYTRTKWSLPHAT